MRSSNAKVSDTLCIASTCVSCKGCSTSPRTEWTIGANVSSDFLYGEG